VGIIGKYRLLKNESLECLICVLFGFLSSVVKDCFLWRRSEAGKVVFNRKGRVVLLYDFVGSLLSAMGRDE
jgi:hypothetical protein